MHCPLLKSDCLKEKCAWWDHGDKACAVLGLKMEMIRLQEALEKPSHAPREHNNTPFVIRNIDIADNIGISDKKLPSKTQEAKSEPITNNTRNQASEIPPTITW